MSAFTATPAQLAAIAADSATIVGAAAGSGKTTVLTQRIVRKLVEDGVAPASLVAVTFTTDAAQEIRTRVQRALDADETRELMERLEQATIGTIHGLCMRIIRDHGARIGVDPSVGVLDEGQANLLRLRAYNDACIALDDDASVQTLRVTFDDKRLRTMFNELRSAEARYPESGLLFPSLAADDASSLELDRACVRNGEAFGVLYRACTERYEAACRKLGKIDFDDQQRYAFELIRLEEVVTALRTRYTTVLVDEFQDTDPLQAAILNAIGGDALFAVGDEWQSIYGFRGADVSVFRAMEQTEGVTPIGMRDNFRSHADILDVVNHAFAADHVFASSYTPVEAGSRVEYADDDPLSGPAVSVVSVPRKGMPWEGEPPEDEEGAAAAASDGEVVVDVPVAPNEQQLIAARVAELIEAGARPEEIAIIARARTHMEECAEALAEWGIPALVASAGSLFDSPDVADALAMLRWVHRSTDDAAGLTVLSSPFAPASWDDLLRLRAATERREPLWTAVAASTDPHMVELATFVRGLREEARDGSIITLVERVLSHPRFSAAMLGRPTGRTHLANIRRLVEYARDAHEIGATDLGSLLEFLDAQDFGGSAKEATLADETTGAVRLLTVHGAKGLEFPFVFVCDLGNPGRSASVSVEVDVDGTVLMPFVNENDGKFIHGERGTAVVEARAEAQQAEAQRVLYVAMTRAKRRMWITYTQPTITKDGSPHKRQIGELGWLLPALDMEIPMATATWTHPSLNLVHERAERPPEPRIVHDAGDGDGQAIATPVFVPTMPDDDSGDAAAAAAADKTREELRHRLRSALALDDDHDERSRTSGILLHAVAAATISPGRAPAAAVADAEAAGLGALARALQGCDTMQLVQSLGGVAEVPYLVATGEAGRIDALVRPRPAGGGARTTAWVVDWKMGLPDSHTACWERHGDQLLRYAQAVAAMQPAPDEVWLSLVPLNDCAHPFLWRWDAHTGAIDVVHTATPPIAP